MISEVQGQTRIECLQVIWYASLSSYKALRVSSYCMVQKKWEINLNDLISSYLDLNSVKAADA